MSIELQHPGGNTLIVKVSGKLGKEDYEQFVPGVEKLIQQAGKVKILFDMHDFHGWKMSALWQDIKFDLKHFKDIERLAMIGESKWEAGMAMFCKPFTFAKIKYFDRKDADQALPWLEGKEPAKV